MIDQAEAAFVEVNESNDSKTKEIEDLKEQLSHASTSASHGLSGGGAGPNKHCCVCHKKHDEGFTFDVCCIQGPDGYCGSILCHDCFDSHCEKDHKHGFVRELGKKYKLSEIMLQMQQLR